MSDERKRDLKAVAKAKEKISKLQNMASFKDLQSEEVIEIDGSYDISVRVIGGKTL